MSDSPRLTSRIPLRSAGESPRERHISPANRRFCGIARVESHVQRLSEFGSRPQGSSWGAESSQSCSTAGSKSPKENSSNVRSNRRISYMSLERTMRTLYPQRISSRLITSAASSRSLNFHLVDSADGVEDEWNAAALATEDGVPVEEQFSSSQRFVRQLQAFLC